MGFRFFILTYMYLRETRQKRADGSLVTHLQLAESVWNPHKKRSEVRIVHNMRATLGLPAFVLVSADRELNAAATADGLTVDNPNHQ